GIVKRRRANVRNEVVGHARPLHVRRRPELQQGFRDRIGDCCPLCVAWYARRAYSRIDLAESFPRTKEKRLVSENRSAERCAVLIAVKWRFWSARPVRKEVGGVQRVIAQEFERGTVEVIRSTFRDDADLTAGA